MFQPPIFREERIEVMHDLMKEHPFATLVSSENGHLSADHLPFAVHSELSENGILRGHIAAGNPLCRGTQERMDVLAVFQGPQAYVSPSWYPSKQEHGKAVPTWNYAVVHAYGVLRFSKDPDWLKDHLVELTSRNESHRTSSWAVSDAPSDYLARQLKGIVGIEIEVETLSGSWKVSQNKADQDRAGVVAGLLRENATQAAAVSDLVKRGTK